MLVEKVFKTRRGKKCVVVDNFTLGEFRTLVKGDQDLCCTKKDCNVRVVLWLKRVIIPIKRAPCEKLQKVKSQQQ